MEEYKKLLWSRHNPRSEGKLLEQASIDFAHFPDDIFNLHINEIDPIHQIEDTLAEDAGSSLPVEMPTDPRTGLKVQQLELKCIKPLCLFDSFPSGSVLTREEHQHCLTVLNRINTRLPFSSPEEQKNYDKYLELMEKLAPETEMFDSFVRNYFNTNLLRRMQTIDPDLNALVVKIWQDKVKERLSLDREQSGKYLLMTVVPLSAYVENETNVIFEPAAHDAHETGSVRNLFTQNIQRCISLKRTQRFLDSFVEEWRNVRCRRAEDLSDINVILRQMPEISFVLPAGALTLLLNHGRNIQDQFTIPFQMKMIDGRKVLIMDSRHPPSKMSTHARKVKAYKLLVKSFMTFSHTKQTEHESSKSCTENDKQGTAAKDFNPWAFDDYMRKVEGRKASGQNQLHENKFYQGWKLTDKDEIHHLLVCFRQDCYESFRKMRVFMNISVKLEYQPEFGAEQMTLAELLQEWCRQLLRPNSKTMRLRVNATSSSIISHHYLELRDIEEELNRLYGVKPQNLLTNVWKMLKLMQHFPTGNYILQRDGKSAQGLSVYAKAIEKAGQADAAGVTLDWVDSLRRTVYDCPPLEQYDWNPIDKFVITHLHRVKTLLPCSFPHWTSVRRLNARQTHVKPKPPQPVGKKGSKKNAIPKDVVTGSKPAKTYTPAQMVRREKIKQRKKAARKQKALAENIQRSLNQFAPYAGPSKPPGPDKNADKSWDKKGTPTANMSQAGLNYESYVEQAAIEPDKQ